MVGTPTINNIICVLVAIHVILYDALVHLGVHGDLLPECMHALL